MSGNKPPIAVIMSVRLSDNTFESSISIPIDAAQERKEAAVLQWLSTMQFGLGLGGGVSIEHVSEVKP